MSIHAARKRAFFPAFQGSAPGEALTVLARMLDQAARVHAYRPADLCEGRGEAEERLFGPLADAPPDLERRDDILLFDSFQAHHQRPFLCAFTDRVGSNHAARFGNGMFVVSMGWPSVTASFAGEWLGCPRSGERTPCG